MLKEVVMRQAEINVDGRQFTVTAVPTATSGQWFTIQDPFEVWAAVAIDLDGTTVGWRTAPDEPWATKVLKAIRQAFDLPEPPEHPDDEENPAP
jgi:hypothetical protein